MPAIIAFLTQLLWLLSFANPEVHPGEPGRVQIREMESGKTVVGFHGELLRGASVGVFKFRRDLVGLPGQPETDYATDPEFWDHMKANGVNAVRVVFFDPWQRSHGDPETHPFKPFPFASLSIADAMLQGAETRREAIRTVVRDREALLEDFDTIVDLAAERHMYVMINYHDTSGYRDPDFEKGIASGGDQFEYLTSMKYLFRFWDLVAPRYSDRAHVFYELMNEPVGFHPNDYSSKDVAATLNLFNRVRAVAPDTHLVLCSFTTPATFNKRSMSQIARQLERRGVDFSNASIGFHPYDISEALSHDDKDLRLVRNRFAIINTEQNLPEDLRLETDVPPAPGYGDDLLGTQSMERMDISWFAWYTSGPDEFAAMYEQILLPDAIAKGYFWGNEVSVAESMSQLLQTMTQDAQDAYVSAWLLFQEYTEGPPTDFDISVE